MPTHDSLEALRAIADRVVRSHGLELFDVQFRREAAGWVFRVIIDRPVAGADASPVGEEGVGVQDCERVSRDLGTVLDVEDPVEQAYVLEVSSPGLDRPLRHEADYRRFTGRLARLVLSEPLEGQTFLQGRLRGVENGEVVIESGGGRTHRIRLSGVVRARLEVEF